MAGLLASRTGLLIHEFAGHGGIAWALGGEVQAWRLFLFGGGWIRYEGNFGPSETMAIALGGIGLEFISALFYWLIARRLRGLSKTLAELIALLLVVHACFYLATGTHYGYGDGRVLHARLAPLAKNLLVTLFSCCVAAGCYALAKRCTASSTFAKAGPRRMAAASICAFFALTTHGALLWGELAIVGRDATYSAIQKREVEVRADQEVALARARAEQEGKRLDAERAQRIRIGYLETHKPFPLLPLLIVAGALAALAGAYRARQVGPSDDDTRLRGWTIVLGASLLFVLLLYRPWFL
jgi:hypothetical protein